jgi:hypothetical protein
VAERPPPFASAAAEGERLVFGDVTILVDAYASASKNYRITWLG